MLKAEKTKYYNRFRKNWKKEIKEVTGLLKILNDSPQFMTQLNEFAPYILPDEVEEVLMEWNILIVQLKHPMDKAFFKPWWLPIQTKSYDVFIDLSNKHLPIFEMHFFWLAPNKWSRNFVFPESDKLLIALDKIPDLNLKFFWSHNNFEFGKELQQNSQKNSKPFDYFNKHDLFNFDPEPISFDEFG